METNNEIKEKQIIIRARAKAKKLREFYAHLRTYLIVNSLFFLINWITSPGSSLKWDRAIASDTYNPFMDFDNDWEESKTKELIKTYKEKS